MDGSEIRRNKNIRKTLVHWVKSSNSKGKMYNFLLLAATYFHKIMTADSFHMLRRSLDCHEWAEAARVLTLSLDPTSSPPSFSFTIRVWHLLQSKDWPCHLNFWIERRNHTGTELVWNWELVLPCSPEIDSLDDMGQSLDHSRYQVVAEWWREGGEGTNMPCRFCLLLAIQRLPGDVTWTILGFAMFSWVTTRIKIFYLW